MNAGLRVLCKALKEGEDECGPVIHIREGITRERFYIDSEVQDLEIIHQHRAGHHKHPTAHDKRGASPTPTMN